ncbi:hypothetical protein MC378_15185 [Polaribacter sp. MSW13]|uniref:Uncharacterized protein n=1 Tax=Polaribacter marinus TaxID=2916838 RepID=A0A9X2ALE1_9FLAO|nr:hypothetical protein [Polaribacter marinus]MCI2230518.1 hypothetical protein [Polaribacter marinus]
MKNLKIGLVYLSVSFFLGCASSNDNNTTPKEIEVEAVLDVSSLASLPDGADITSLVSFEDGQSAANYTTEAIIGDEISYIIKTNSSTTTTWNAGFIYNSGDLEFWNTGLEYIYLPNIPGAQQGEEMIAGFTIKEGVTVGSEIKFDIQINLVENGVLDNSKTFIIDPKIKIRRTR